MLAILPLELPVEAWIVWRAVQDEHVIAAQNGADRGRVVLPGPIEPAHEGGAMAGKVLGEQPRDRSRRGAPARGPSASDA